MKVLVYTGATAFVVAFVGGIWWTFMALWNWLVPALFHGPAITYWQAAGLLILFGLITSGLRASAK